MKSPGSKSVASAPGPYRSTLTMTAAQAETREHLLGEPADDASLERVREVDDEVLDANLGVLMDHLGDTLRRPVQRMPRPDVGLVFSRASRSLGHHAIDLVAVAEDRVELDRLEH